MSANWSAGNAMEDSGETRWWLVGHFVHPTLGVRSTNDVEVKWAYHPTGDRRPEWTSGDRRTTLTVLIEGGFRVTLSERRKNLNDPATT